MGVAGKRLSAGETGDYSAFLSSQLEHRRFEISLISTRPDRD